mmetsp:Transcript_19058/g.31201  ORF Transcript_19058/g.31201 Transcript_19058/m.31201 type:complete len:603 (-) Transcript_19058:1290-3098(-)
MVSLLRFFQSEETAANKETPPSAHREDRSGSEITSYVNNFLGRNENNDKLHLDTRTIQCGTERRYSVEIVSRAGARDSKNNSLYTIYELAVECAVVKKDSDDMGVLSPSSQGAVVGESETTKGFDTKRKKWKVWRRYKEFRRLQSCLYDRNGYSSLPLLPPRKLIGTFDPDFLDGRQVGLNNWLQDLLAIQETIKGFELVEVFLLDSELSMHSPITLVPSSMRSVATTPEAKKKVSLEDFEALRVIGKGSFGKVVVVRRRQSKKLYAMKILKKSNLRKRKQVEHTKTERRVMEHTNHPFIVDLYYAFQTKSRLFLVLDYVPGGELFFHLGRFKEFPEAWARIWTGEIVLALEHLHSLNIVFRDLKPENILFDSDGHVKLIDFGLSKDGIEDTAGGTNSFCGTPEYLAPEILNRHGHGKAVDFWNLGMVLYEMLTGLPPWYSRNKRKLFERLRHAPLTFPNFVSISAQSVIRGFLTRNPEQRLGCVGNGFATIKSHPFFMGIDWEKLLNKEIEPGFKPNLSHEHLEHDPRNADDSLDTSNFDEAFTSLPLDDCLDSEDEDDSSSCTNSQTSEVVVESPVSSKNADEELVVTNCVYENFSFYQP